MSGMALTSGNALPRSIRRAVELAQDRWPDLSFGAQRAGFAFRLLVARDERIETCEVPRQALTQAGATTQLLQWLGELVATMERGPPEP